MKPTTAKVSGIPTCGSRTIKCQRISKTISKMTLSPPPEEDEDSPPESKCSPPPVRASTCGACWARKRNTAGDSRRVLRIAAATLRQTGNSNDIRKVSLGIPGVVNRAKRLQQLCTKNSPAFRGRAPDLGTAYPRYEKR